MNSSGTYRLLFKKYPDVVDVNQLSQMLNINLKAAYKLLLDKKIDYVHNGRTYRIAKSCIIRFLCENTDSVQNEI